MAFATSSRRRVLLGIAAAAALFTRASLASDRAPRKIVWLFADDKAPARVREMFRSRGISEGRDIALRFLEHPDLGDKEAKAFAGTLVRSRPDVVVLVARSLLLLKELKQRTRDIPVVFHNFGGSPVDAGLVESLARPGGNFTGTTETGDMAARMQQEWHLIKQLVPSIKRAALILDRGHGDPKWMDEMLKMDREAAARSGIEVVWMEVPQRGREDVARAVRASGAQFIMADSSAPTEVVEFLFTEPIASYCLGFGNIRRGCLFGTRSDFTEGEDYAVSAVQRILRGESPAVIPVYQHRNWEFALNRRKARELGIDIPAAILIRAKEVYD